jgi:hypothetical protein
MYPVARDGRQREGHGARALYGEAIDVARTLDDRWAVANGLMSLGNALLEEGDVAAARLLLEESLAGWRVLGDQSRVAAALIRLGKAARIERDDAEARALLQEGLTLAQTLGYQFEILVAIRNLAALDVEQGLAVRAARLLGAEDALRTSIGYVPGPSERGVLADAMAAARMALDTAGFADAWAAGTNWRRRKPSPRP